MTPCTITSMIDSDGRLFVNYSCGTLAEVVGEADSDTVRLPCPEHPPKVERCSCEEASLYREALESIAAHGDAYSSGAAARALEGVEP